MRLLLLVQKLKQIVMASVKRLKKDVDFLTAAVISDCLNFNSIQDEVNPEVATIVQDMLVFRAQMRTKIAAGKKQVGEGGVKAYYRSLANEIMQTVDAKFSRLSEIIKNA